MLYSATKIKTADLEINAGIHYRKREQEGKKQWIIFSLQAACTASPTQ